MLAQKSSSTYAKAEELTDELNSYANKLEILVQERTREILLQKEEIDLRKVVEDAYSITGFIMENSGLDFHNEVGENIKLHADEDMIKRVISNILSNAAKYSRRQGFVRLSCEKHISDNGQKFAKVIIYNNGDPIAANKLDAIFENYTQAAKTNESPYHSTGIGLAYCKLAINAHGGEIAAISGEESGVTFWFTLPVYA